MSEVLARRERALTPEETEQLLRDRLEDGVQRTVQEFGVFTVWIEPGAWVDAATLCRDERRLAYDMFDCLLGIDAREEGFDVVAVLYSTTTGNRIVLRTRCEGGREAPTCPSLAEVYRGADWMEREAYDMFAVDFPGHPSLEPRLLTVENFEGWPLRKDFYLASRVVKPWPGVAEPKELDEEGNVIEREVRMGDAPGPYDIDKAIAEQAKLANPKPEPEVKTTDAENIDELAADADQAPDSDRVLTGGQEQDAEVAEAQASDVSVDVAGERAGDDEQAAKTKAEQRRKEQAEARARKAAERTEQSTQDQPADANADVPGEGDAEAEAGPVEDTGADGDRDGQEGA